MEHQTRSRGEHKSSWFYALWAMIFFFGGSFFFFAGSCLNLARYQVAVPKVAGDSVMLMDLNGVIFDSKKFLKQLKKYRKEDSVKAFVIRINSPGGVVGPSQELNFEIRKTREEFKKPVVVFSESLNASGAYYASVAADKIVVSPGALVGSIGVIMEFANLQGLYQWAKVERYSLKSGEFKDIGSEFRPMTERERSYLQDMISEVLAQFKSAILAGRKISETELNLIADGRVFTGAKAKSLNLVDEEGSLQTAVDLAGELSGLGKNPEVFEPPKDHKFYNLLMDYGQDAEDEVSNQWMSALKNFAGLKLSGQLLFVYPAGVPAGLLSSEAE